MAKADDYYRSDKARMLPYVPTDAASLLDVGCGSGVFGARLKADRPGLEVWGVEPVERAADEARSVLDRVVVGRFPEVVPELGRTFDVVVFNDVLEHLVDPWAALEATHSLVADGGAVVASVPNVRNWRTIIDLVRHGRWEHEAAGIHDADHLRWFTRRTLVEAFERTGWRVEVAAMANPSGFRRDRLYGTLLRPIAPDLGAEAGFKQLVLVARSDAAGG
ncbi:MAG TPA: class I SAM-dependent methyltransferase [Acidimicrobiales bacterium]|nr:class I SAM-dependent methyltransferase [Acidimicrobiales bacterium]